MERGLTQVSGGAVPFFNPGKLEGLAEGTPGKGKKLCRVGRGRLLSDPKRCHHWHFASLSMSDGSGGGTLGAGAIGAEFVFKGMVLERSLMFGEFDRERGPFAQLTLKKDLSVMKLNDFLDEGQANPETFEGS